LDQAFKMAEGRRSKLRLFSFCMRGLSLDCASSGDSTSSIALPEMAFLASAASFFWAGTATAAGGGCWAASLKLSKTALVKNNEDTVTRRRMVQLRGKVIRRAYCWSPATMRSDGQPLKGGTPTRMPT